MKAVLLAAGLGTRLRPITDNIPKCLVPIRGKPLLGYWLDALVDAGVESVLVNLHYLADQVSEFVETRTDRNRITLIEEPVLLGTAGTVRENSGFFAGDKGLVIHADNFCGASIEKLINAHSSRPEGTEITMMTFRTNDPSACGIIEIDRQGVVQGFHEKVADPPGRIANAAIYVFEQSVIQCISASRIGEFVDISRDVIPRYIGRIFATPADGPVIDIGTPENFERAQYSVLRVD